MTRLATDVQQDHNIYDAWRSLPTDPAMQFQIELAEALQLQPKLFFVKGAYVHLLNQSRLALLQPPNRRPLQTTKNGPARYHGNFAEH